MDDAELQFIQALGISQQQMGELPIISPQDFVNMSKSIRGILDDLQKKTNC